MINEEWWTNAVSDLAAEIHFRNMERNKDLFNFIVYFDLFV